LSPVRAMARPFSSAFRCTWLRGLPMHKSRILLADDHGVVREGLKSLINAQPDLEVVGEAGDGESACRMAEELLPDLVVMDVSMPGLTGDRATSRLGASCPGVRVLALTVHEDREHLRRLLKAGASGYVLKLATGEDFLRSLRVVAAGGVYLDPAVAGKVVGDLLQERGDLGPADEGSLTQREAEVILRVARGFSNKEIAAQLDISVKTVETHKLRSMEKLNLRSRADVVQFALKRGWLTPS
jgi:DNA-binding NarL/FixJ family response regulator